MNKWVKRVAIAAIMLGCVAIGHNVNIYDGLNKGITWGNCGIEVKPHLSTFCDNPDNYSQTGYKVGNHSWM